jgi:recombination associated protein RdgC
MFSGSVFYKLDGLDLPMDDLDELLSLRQLVPCPKAALSNEGWVSFSNDEYVCEANKALLFTYGVNKKSLPAKVVKEKVKEECDALIERNGGQALSKKVISEVKEKITLSLIPHLLPVRDEINVMIDSKRKWIAIDTTSKTKAENIIAFMRQSLPDVKIKVKPLSPGIDFDSLFRRWINDKDKVPNNIGFTGDATLKDDDGGKITLVNQDLSSDDIRVHFESMFITKIGLIRDDVRFSIDEKLVLSSLVFSPELTMDYELPEENDPNAENAYRQSMLILFRKQFDELYQFIDTEFECLGFSDSDSGSDIEDEAA